MPTNQYFQNGQRAERQLYENLIIEAIKIYGQDVYYIPRKIIKKDLILNEDLISSFEKHFKVEMYIESVDGFEGDGDLLSKFGLEVRDQIVLVVADQRWNHLVGRYGYTANTVRPGEGDLIYLPLANSLLEIKFVENKKPFYQLKNLPIHRLTCEMFEYESQEIDTGITAIDNIQRSDSDGSVLAYLTIDEDGSLIAGETLDFVLPDETTGYAEFFRYVLSDDPETPPRIHIGPSTYNDGRYHEIAAGAIFTGRQSGASVEIDETYNLRDDNLLIFPNDLLSQNSDFSRESQVSDFIDFSEENPFGEPFNIN